MCDNFYVIQVKCVWTINQNLKEKYIKFFCKYRIYDVIKI